MYNARLLFSKTGAAAYISHLDLMQTIQRSLLRARLPVKYSEGFNPHIYLSILVPLSTGYKSLCELCDFDLLIDEPPADIIERLNAALPAGITAVKLGQAVRPVAEVAFCGFEIEYPCGDACAMQTFFERDSIFITKQSKRGSKEVDLKEYVKEISFTENGEGTICHAVLKAGNDPLNPAYITLALKENGLIPEEEKAFYTRTSVLDKEGEAFFPA